MTRDGQVMNKILNAEKEYSESELIEFSNYFTNNYSGLTIEEAYQKINNEIIDTKKKMFDLMKSAMDTSNL